MPQRAQHLADKIFEGFLTYIETFNTYTRLAPLYFAQRNWKATQLNHRQRLRLYKDLLFQLAKIFQQILGADSGDRNIRS
jgi:isocitrate dehydrogenase kinase/phosphatase